MIDSIILGDCLELLPTIERDSIPLVLTDPPYGSNKEWDGVTWEFQAEWLEKVYQVMSQDSSLYFFFPPLKLGKMLPLVEELFTLKNLIVWYHSNLYGAGASYGKDRFKSTWEVIIYATKGRGLDTVSDSYTLTGSGFDVFIEPYPMQASKHPARKPAKVIRKIILLSSKPDDIVLDPFCGSGVVCQTALQMNRHYIGIEKLEGFHKMAVKSMQGVTKDMF